MLNLSDYDPHQKSGEPRRYFNYEGSFGGIIRRDGFGLHGKGTLSTNAPQSKIELMGEIPLPLLITIPLGLIPLVGRAARTFYRPTGDFSFQAANVSELVRKKRQIQFKAPKREGGKPKRVEFLAKTENEAQEIENFIRQHNPAVAPGKLVSGWWWIKTGVAASAVLIGLFLLLLAGASIKRYFGKDEGVYVRVNRRLNGNSNRNPVTSFSDIAQYPESEKGMFKRGGDIFLIATIAPDGSVSNVEVDEKYKSYSVEMVTKNPVLIESALNSARQIKYQPDKSESKIQFWYRFTTRFDRALDSTLY